MNRPASHKLVDPGFAPGISAIEVAQRSNLRGRTAIVTGGNSGLGLATAEALAVAGADVVLAVRDIEAGRAAAAAIAKRAGSLPEVAECDLASLASVRGFAAQWGERPLSLLIANAGVMATPESETQDGFELQMGVNHLGHFLLANLLANALQHGAPSRVVVMSSGGHALADLDPREPDRREAKYNPFAAYARSKMANVLFMVEFDRRFRASGIRAFAVNPGAAKTGLERHVTKAALAAIGFDDGFEIEYKDVASAASTMVWAATGHELDGMGGLYLEDCREAVVTGDEDELAGVRARAIDPERARTLWEASEKLVGMSDGQA